MVHHLLSVCIFCFICATHSPCASHAAIGRIEQHRHDGYKDPNIPKLENNPQLNLRKKPSSVEVSDSHFDADIARLTTRKHNHILKRSVGKDETSNNSETDFLKRIFLKYGNGDMLTVEGFEKLLKRLDLLQTLSNKLYFTEGEHSELSSLDVRKEAREIDGNNETCFNQEALTILTTKHSTGREPLNHASFSETCPLLIYSLLAEACPPSENDVFDVRNPEKSGPNNTLVWLYSLLAVLLISICGVLALVIIPVMQKRFYKPLIQFLVALAVGTLAGDALLHLLPHAMGEGHGHAHEDTAQRNNHLQNTWKGFVAMLGLTFFFIMERLILLAGNWRKTKQKHSTVTHAHVKVLNDKGERRNSTQCMDKYNTSPYCYKDIMTEPRSNSDLQMKKPRPSTLEKLEANQNLTECQSDLISSPCIEDKMLPYDHEDYTVIVREHANDHHGHSHKHGHVHAAPQNFSSVAWMVIMGDGLHNFTDGMAIGAAFSSGLAGGFSTTVAVFCHELPHELGDFAMLLKAGMSIKQALFYNMLSSVLCILGNLFGLWLGNTEEANSWVFAAAAGTFIYIALVDMIPELSSAHDEENKLLQCILHLSGLLLGFGIMTIIAVYEHDLKHLFHDPE